MRRLVIFSLCALAGTASWAQTAVDTTLYIQNVEVAGRRFAGLSGGEWKRLQVGNNLSALTGTAADAFRQMPSVITDIEGGITFRGSNKAALLLDGVPYGLLEEHSGDLLIQLPALFFDRLSATSYPAISMVPDGDAGLLNLTSTVPTADDSPLQLALGAGWHERYNAGAVVNCHPGRFHVVGKYNYRREFRERMFRKSTVTPSNRTEMQNNAAAHPDVHVADLRVGYDVTRTDRLTVYGLYTLMDYDRYGRINNRVFNPVGEQMKYVIRNRYNHQRQEAYAAEAAWRHSFAHPGELLQVRFNYNNFVYDEDNDFKNENPKTGAIVAEDNQRINRDKHNYYWSAAYQRALSDGWSLQGGYIGRFKEEQYDTEAQNKSGQGWNPNPQKTYAYDFKRSLHLLYASVQKQWSQFTAEAGLQGEFSRQQVEEVSDNSFRLYPRVRFDYHLRRHAQLSLSYQQRAVRPSGAYLSPYTDYSDATHLLQGNPSLQDEWIHAAALNYRLDLSALRFSTGLFYRNRQDRMMEIATQQDENTLWRLENVGNSQTVGWDVSVRWSPVSLLAIGVSGELYRDEIDGRAVGYGQKKSLVCGDVKGTLNLSLTSATELQMDAFYISDQLTPQGKVKDRYSVNVGVSHYFCNRKLRANLSVNNLFDSLGETTIINTETMQMTQVRDRDARVAWLTLTYSL